MKTLFKILNIFIFISLFWSKLGLAAVYIPSDTINPGSLQFWNVRVDASSNIRATLIAQDNLSIYAGQTYELNLADLGPPSGPQDATYNSLSQQIVAQNVIQTLEEHFAVALHLTKLDLTTNVLEFTITELRSQTIGFDNQIVEQITTFVAGPKGDTGPPGPPGPQGEKGDPGSFPSGNAPGDMQYWDGKNWVVIPLAPERDSPPQLTHCNGVPRWMQYKIGDRGPAGGIVFYLDGCGGLEAATTDQSTTGAQWGCNGTEIDGADETAVGSGVENTADILSGCSESGIAAEIVANYEFNGYKDWFLPSREELYKLYKKKDVVDDFANVAYWSSSETSSSSAWSLDFFDGFIGDTNKNFPLRVRAVRAF